jgi:hypothetical protein
LLIYLIIQKYNEYCYNLRNKPETYNERFGMVPESHEMFDGK